MLTPIPVLTAEQIASLEYEFPGELAQGYLDGLRNAEWPEDFPSPAYEHGRRLGVNDRLVGKKIAA